MPARASISRTRARSRVCSTASSPARRLRMAMARPVNLLLRRRKKLHAGVFVHHRDRFDRTRTRRRDNYRVAGARRVDDFGLAVRAELKHAWGGFHAVAAADAT